MDARKMAIAKALRRAAVHAAIASLICLCLKGLVLVNTEALFGQTLFWALVWIIGRVALYWMHLMNNVQNFEMLMEIFGTYTAECPKHPLEPYESGVSAISEIVGARMRKTRFKATK